MPINKITCIKLFNKRLKNQIIYSPSSVNLSTSSSLWRRIDEFKNSEYDVREAVIKEYKYMYEEWKTSGKIFKFFGNVQFGIVLGADMIVYINYINVNATQLMCINIASAILFHLTHKKTEMCYITCVKIDETIERLEEVHANESNRI